MAKYVVELHYPQQNIISSVDIIEAPADYTAEQYIEDCKDNADPDWNNLLANGIISLIKVD